MNFKNIRAFCLAAFLLAAGPVFTQNFSFRVIGAVPCYDDGKFYLLQVGAFRVYTNAERAASTLRRIGLTPCYERYRDLTRVFIAEVRAFEVSSRLNVLRNAGFREVFIREDPSRSGSPGPDRSYPGTERPPENAGRDPYGYPEQSRPERRPAQDDPPPRNGSPAYPQETSPQERRPEPNWDEPPRNGPDGGPERSRGETNNNETEKKPAPDYAEREPGVFNEEAAPSGEKKTSLASPENSAGREFLFRSWQSVSLNGDGEAPKHVITFFSDGTYYIVRLDTYRSAEGSWKEEDGTEALEGRNTVTVIKLSEDSVTYQWDSENPGEAGIWESVPYDL